MGTYNCFKTTKGYECVGFDAQGHKLLHTTHGSSSSAYMECLAWEGRGHFPVGTSLKPDNFIPKHNEIEVEQPDEYSAPDISNIDESAIEKAMNFWEDRLFLKMDHQRLSWLIAIYEDAKTTKRKATNLPGSDRIKAIKALEAGMQKGGKMIGPTHHLITGDSAIMSERALDELLEYFTIFKSEGEKP